MTNVGVVHWQYPGVRNGAALLLQQRPRSRAGRVMQRELDVANANRLLEGRLTTAGGHVHLTFHVRRNPHWRVAKIGNDPSGIVLARHKQLLGLINLLGPHAPQAVIVGTEVVVIVEIGIVIASVRPEQKVVAVKIVRHQTLPGWQYRRIPSSVGEDLGVPELSCVGARRRGCGNVVTPVTAVAQRSAYLPGDALGIGSTLSPTGIGWNVVDGANDVPCNLLVVECLVQKGVKVHLGC
mmetsp:Transcript_84050/g.224635  ORF Transcript_84050/g.224635 Transcript_84050/m.224635 type:complete len:238 (+) Transcript_84050:843-1556(+)